MLTLIFRRLDGGGRKCLLLLACWFLMGEVKGQEIEWQNTIGGSNVDELNSIQQTADGGYIIGGSSGSPISSDKTENCVGNFDYWIIKTDSIGSTQWQNTIGGTDVDYLASIKQTNDGGYIAGGYSASSGSGDKTGFLRGFVDYWILKLDSIGNIKWQKTIGGAYSDVLKNITITNDGGYLLGGTSDSYASFEKSENSNGITDFWLVKVDSVGNILWDKTIGGNNNDEFTCMVSTFDGGFLVGGYSESNISGDKTENSKGVSDYWIVKLDSLGNILWQNTIGGNFYDDLFSVSQTLDNGYILCGASASDSSGDKTEGFIGAQLNNDFWIIKVDSTGSIVWQNIIGGGNDDIPYSVQPTNDNEIIIAGNSYSAISGDKTEDWWIPFQFLSDFWVVKIDSLSNINWQNTIGGFNEDALSIISPTNNGGFILGGKSNSNISGDKTENSKGGDDYWIVKLSGDFNSITGKTFLDLNSNSTQDVSEPSLQNRKITEANTGRFAFTEQNGLYSLTVLNVGNFSVSTNHISSYSIIPVSHSATFTGINQTDSLNDFAFQPLGTFNDLCVTLTPLGAFRPGFDASYMINYENVGTTTLSPTVTLYQNGLLSYVGATVAPTVTSTDSVQWSGLPLLSPFQSGSILVTLNISASAVIGSNIYSQCIIEPIANDYNVYCNYSGVSSVVTGSVDPNDILVSEDTLSTTQLATQPFLDYTIRFQNTGNDTAFTVKIINPIDTNKLELSSIEFVNASHPVQLKWVNYNKNMEFLLENILLPDSNVNEPESHGFVHYRIKPKTSLLAGDSATNKGYIYFDFNAPVETNTAVTKIVLPTGIKQLAKDNGQLAVFPNPTKDELNIQLNQIVQKGKQEITISIFDVLGNIVLSRQSGSANCKLPTAHFSKGIYFVEVKTGTEVYRAKFVKE